MPCVNSIVHAMYNVITIAIRPIKHSIHVILDGCGNCCSTKASLYNISANEITWNECL